MIRLSLFIVIIKIIEIECDASKCPTCPITPKHYQELGCIGKLDKNECCFESFECRDFPKFEKNQCKVKGRSYEILDKINAKYAPVCSESCRCVEAVDQQWPDEIDSPLDIPARTRFQTYRGLESFRISPWDVKENLPNDYARIYQFKNFDRIRCRVIKEAVEVDGAEPGWYITIHIVNVSQSLWRSWLTGQSEKCIIVYGLLPHEDKMCVVNAVLKRAPDSTIPIKSKEKMILQSGFRGLIVNKIFSAHTNGNKHKYERFFRANETVVATFYAPIQFPPAPILCFQEQPDTTLKLVANGVLMSCNPDRVVLKRIVLGGHPFKINRRTATIRYMFFNKEDVEYFKPIKLRTRCGRLGHIKESLGTHGHLKCVFDGQLKSFDSVFLYLYKRVFSKWQYEDCVVTSSMDDGKDSE